MGTVVGWSGFMCLRKISYRFLDIFISLIRFGTMAHDMIQRVRKQISEEKTWFQENGRVIPQGLVQKDFLTEKVTGHILSTLGLVYNELGRKHDLLNSLLVPMQLND